MMCAGSFIFHIWVSLIVYINYRLFISRDTTCTPFDTGLVNVYAWSTSSHSSIWWINSSMASFSRTVFVCSTTAKLHRMIATIRWCISSPEWRNVPSISTELLVRCRRTIVSVSYRWILLTRKLTYSSGFGSWYWLLCSRCLSSIVLWSWLCPNFVPVSYIRNIAVFHLRCVKQSAGKWIWAIGGSF